MSTTLGLVIPCYNEEAVLGETVSRLTSLMTRLIEAGKISANSRIHLVDDGSKDRTWELIAKYCEEDELIKGIKLSRNRGHQNALIAGLSIAAGDALISLDADLQDDIEAIERMVDAYSAGNEVVYGVRKSRNDDTAFKRATAQGFYRLMTSLGVETVYDHADYRLLSRRAVDSLMQFSEVNMFLRGIVPLLGFQSTTVEYTRSARFAGDSKYPFKKMVAFAIEGITSFSVLPLRIITVTGIVISLGTLLMSAWILGVRIFTDAAIPGWASTTLPIYFLGGVQLFGIGILGEYLGKIYMEVKRRPRYFIEQVL